jgi:hypothetical protein
VNQIHLLHARREFEAFSNDHRTHRTLHAAAPRRQLPQPITEADELNSSPSGDEIDSVASFTSITVPPEQHG